MSKKRICLIIPSLGVGGMQRVLASLGNHFCEIPGNEIHLIIYSIKREIFYSISEKIILHKPEFIFNEKARLISTIRTMLFIRRRVKEINPVTILSFGEYWNSFVLLSLMGLRKPVYISDRCKPDRKYSFFHQILRRWLYPKSTGIIAQTAIAKRIYQNLFKHANILVIGNPIRKIDNSNTYASENIVLTVGRLIPTKNHEILIDIFLKTKEPLWKLVIIGDNAPPFNMMNKLKRKIFENNATDRIILTGNISEVDEYYIKSKIFAFTSSSEGFPNVIGEAMSAGLPVIAFDCIAGPAEMITDGVNGFLIPLFNKSEFIEKLSLLMNNESLRSKMSVAAQKNIDCFSVNKIGNQYYNFILNNVKVN